MKAFDYINIKNLDISKENEKMKMAQLTIKLFDNIKN